jgi:hypothetical protein
MLFCGSVSGGQDTANTFTFTLNGSATTTTHDGLPVLELTPALSYQAGSAFTASPVVLDSEYKFAIVFQFQMARGSGAADGMTFVLQTEGPTALGGDGGCLGYGGASAECTAPVTGITPSVAVEFDTYENSPVDINDNHVAILTDGQINDLDPQTPYGVTDCVPAGTFGCMANGDVWTVWIDYNGTNLNVALADNSTTRPPSLISYPIDLASILGQNSVYFGFTAGTGAIYQKHWVFNIH